MTPFDVMMSGFTTDASFTLTPFVPFILTGEPSTVLTVTFLPVKSPAFFPVRRGMLKLLLTFLYSRVLEVCNRTFRSALKASSVGAKL